VVYAGARVMRGMVFQRSNHMILVIYLPFINEPVIIIVD
jgi:hypothetical protein